MEAEKVELVRPLSIQQVTDILEQFAGTSAEWFMSLASFLDGETFYRQPRKVDLVVWLNGQEMGRWRVLPISFRSLVTCHAQAPKGTFAIPHANCYQYAEYPLLKQLKQQAQALLDSMAPAVNALWKQMYALDDTLGVPLKLSGRLVDLGRAGGSEVVVDTASGATKRNGCPGELALSL